MRYAAADRRSPPSLPQSARVCTYDLSFLGMALDKKRGEGERRRKRRGERESCDIHHPNEKVRKIPIVQAREIATNQLISGPRT